jgi:outer membrane protein W
MSNEKKIFLFICLMILMGSWSFSQGQKYQIFLFGGVNYHFMYGSENDYVLGENDFPVTPAHVAPLFGLAYGNFSSGGIGVELEGKYTLSCGVSLEDPSDKDIVEVDTSRHLTLVLNVIYQLSRGKFRPYILAGGGADLVMARDAVYTSKYGYEILVPAPSKKERVDVQVHAGGGAQFRLCKNLGLRADVRHVWIFDKPHSVKSVHLAAGLFLGF